MKFLASWLPVTLTVVAMGCGNEPQTTDPPLDTAVNPPSKETLAETVAAVTDPFREGVNKAMAAADLAQTAKTAEDWERVEGLWGEAVKSMGAVPTLSEKYGIAQTKVVEYQKNREYAQENIERIRQSL
jgi:hypothetical protein